MTELRAVNPTNYLVERETEVLRRIADGEDSDEIARAMGYAVPTPSPSRSASASSSSGTEPPSTAATPI